MYQVRETIEDWACIISKIIGRLSSIKFRDESRSRGLYSDNDDSVKEWSMRIIVLEDNIHHQLRLESALYDVAKT